MNLVSILISLQSVFQTIRILKAPTIVTNATTILNGGSTVVTISPSSSILPTAATDSIVLQIVVPVLFFIVLILVVVAVVVFYLRYVINNMQLMQSHLIISLHSVHAARARRIMQSKAKKPASIELSQVDSEKH